MIMAIPEGTDLMEDLEETWYNLCHEWKDRKIANHTIVIGELVTRLVAKWQAWPNEVRPIVERFYNEHTVSVDHNLNPPKPI